MPAKPITVNEIREAQDAVRQHGSISAAARALNVPRTTLQHRVYATSTLVRGGDGDDFALMWIKERGNEEMAWEESLRNVYASMQPVKPIAMSKAVRAKDLLAVYPIGDHHVGMRAWGAETGADYDIKIAKRILVTAVSHLLSVTPDTEEGLIVDVGDFFHVDNLKNETSRSHHTLDVDTRYQHMIEAGIEMLRTCIDMGLQKHRKLRVICTPGNHNDIGAAWLQLALALLYEKNPRVEIDRTPGKFHYHHFGQVLIGVTHGDTGKPEKLAQTMPADQPELWGKTKFRYWITGHVHNRTQVELPGVMWETFRTLASRDAWAQAQGYRAGRDMTSIIMHREFGEVARHRFDVAMLKDAA
jgi:hypothetical protein